MIVTRERTRELADTLRLLRADLGVPQPQRVDELLQFRNARDVLHEHDSFLGAALDDAAEADIERWLARGYGITTVLDVDYPALLREVHESPGIIYWQGTLDPSERGVSIVGSRKATPRAVEATYSLAVRLAEEGIPVISGLADGVDTAAHSGALAVGGRTIAVVGTGLHTTYPRHNAALRSRIEQHHGLVLSQFEPDSPIRRWNFPMRNAVMSGYGVATIVMAADEKSGTRHQAQAAVKHGRGLIFAGGVSDRVSWAHQYVKQRKAHAAHSLDEAVELADMLLSQRDELLSLF